MIGDLLDERIGNVGEHDAVAGDRIDIDVVVANVRAQEEAHVAQLVEHRVVDDGAARDQDVSVGDLRRH